MSASIARVRSIAISYREVIRKRFDVWLGIGVYNLFVPPFLLFSSLLDRGVALIYEILFFFYNFLQIRSMNYKLPLPLHSTSTAKLLNYRALLTLLWLVEVELRPEFDSYGDHQFSIRLTTT